MRLTQSTAMSEPTLQQLPPMQPTEDLLKDLREHAWATVLEMRDGGVQPLDFLAVPLMLVKLHADPKYQDRQLDLQNASAFLKQNQKKNWVALVKEGAKLNGQQEIKESYGTFDSTSVIYDFTGKSPGQKTYRIELADLPDQPPRRPTAAENARILFFMTSGTGPDGQNNYTRLQEKWPTCGKKAISLAYAMLECAKASYNLPDLAITWRALVNADRTLKKNKGNEEAWLDWSPTKVQEIVGGHEGVLERFRRAAAEAALPAAPGIAAEETPPPGIVDAAAVGADTRKAPPPKAVGITCPKWERKEHGVSRGNESNFRSGPSSSRSGQAAAVPNGHKRSPLEPGLQSTPTSVPPPHPPKGKASPLSLRSVTAPGMAQQMPPSDASTRQSTKHQGRPGAPNDLVQHPAAEPTQSQQAWALQQSQRSLPTQDGAAMYNPEEYEMSGSATWACAQTTQSYSFSAPNQPVGGTQDVASTRGGSATWACAQTTPPYSFSAPHQPVCGWPEALGAAMTQPCASATDLPATMQQPWGNKAAGMWPCTQHTTSAQLVPAAGGCNFGPAAAPQQFRPMPQMGPFQGTSGAPPPCTSAAVFQQPYIYQHPDGNELRSTQPGHFQAAPGPAETAQAPSPQEAAAAGHDLPVGPTEAEATIEALTHMDEDTRFFAIRDLNMGLGTLPRFR